ncbi:IS66 family insertion sequence element accessory protein TnpB [Rhodoferax sp. TBRC 17660]|uniref:IS66 family insertion sequence element accessory protein TnpB n=1 Tax=Rhodoferax potami TaxID=3068338 RepID=A0ABU3KT16_9BURK|nr:IS66 family insertion sequence element accessory protein TnpB [Rhodoferax sp. TBRC 17660]MDT7520582.1 IS66 family insertion sequence element accessory protein TnpB [Rhodoferax sp. TBRC 17660]
MIRIDALWLCTHSQDMRAGADRLLSVVVNTLGQAQAHHGYLFANARASRIKLLVHDGFGVWCANRRLHCSSVASNLTLWCWVFHGSDWRN